MKNPLVPHTRLLLVLLLSVTLVASLSYGCKRNEATTPEPVPTTEGGTSTTTGETKSDDGTKTEEKEETEDADDKQPTTVVTRIGSTVQQMLSVVFRIRGNPRQLATNRSYGLRTGDRIKTDDSGTARVNIAGCMTVYVFAASGLRMSTCPGFARGSAVCLGDGTALFNNSCRPRFKNVETDTAQIQLEGTRFRVAYWPEKKRTIMDVQEGPVVVRQALPGNGRNLGEPVIVKEGCWCAPSDQCFKVGVPFDGPQPCTNLTPENAAYLNTTTDQTADILGNEKVPIAPAPTTEGTTTVVDPQGRAAVDVQMIDFGAIDPGDDLVKSLKLTNISSLPLKVDQVLLDKSSLYFKKAGDSCLNKEIEMGKACVVEVAFSPMVVGNFEGSIQVSDNAKGSPRTVLLKGKAIRTWTGSTELHPDALQFGSQALGVQSNPKEITISKVDAISTPTFEGPAKDDFKVISNNCTDTSTFCALQVSFKPSAVGDRIASLVISAPQVAGGATPPQKIVALRGTGTGAPVVPALPPPVIAVGAEAVCFQAHKVIDPKAVLIRKREKITIENRGAGPLEVKSVFASSPDFVVDSQDCKGRSVTDKCEISVGFTPTDTGTRTGVLTINSNDPKQPAKEVQLAGRGKHRNWFVRGLQWIFRINQGDKCEF